MILKSLKLNNIRSYIDNTLDFPEGSVLLSGDIGSGKSTILLAIEFALFGLRRTHLPGSALLRHGKNQGSVELKFEIEGKEIIVKRNLKRQKNDIQQSSGFIIQNQLKTEATPVELKAKILDILGYPKSELTKTKDFIYRYTVYTQQEQMKQILLEPADQRLDTLRRVFGIDRYKKIRENATIITKQFKEKINLYKGQTEGLEQKQALKLEKDKQIEELKIKLNKILPELEKKNIELKITKNKILESEKQIEELRDIKIRFQLQETRLQDLAKRHMENSNDIKVLELQITELNKKIQETKAIEPQNKDKKAIENAIIKLDQELKDITNKKTKLIEKCRFLEQNLEKLDKEVKDKTLQSRDLRVKQDEMKILEKEVEIKNEVNKKIAELDLELTRLTREISELETRLKISKGIKDSIQKLSNCPTCFQEVSGEHKRKISESEDKKIEASSSQLELLKQKRMLLEKQKSDLNNKLEEIINKENILTKIRTEISSLKQLNFEVVEKQKAYSEVSLEKIKLDYELDTLDDLKIEELNIQLDELRNQLKIIHEYELRQNEKRSQQMILDEKNKQKSSLEKHREEFKTEIAEINKIKLELNSKIEDFREKEHILNRFKQELETQLQQEKKIEIEKSNIEQNIQSINLQIKEILEEINKKLESKNKLSKLSQHLRWMENNFIPLMAVIEKQIMSTVYIEFNEYLEKWFKTLMEDETLNIRLNEDFSPIIEQNGYETSIENLSGGEKTAASLAYRLALNKVINDVQSTIRTKDLIILDEPTDGFSSAQLDKVRDVFEQLNINQIILVSHETKIESFVDNIIRINKNEHISQVLS